MAQLQTSLPTKLNFIILLLVALMLIRNVRTEVISETKLEEENKTSVAVKKPLPQQKTFKKDLRVNITDESIENEATLPPENDGHADKLIIIEGKSLIETNGKAKDEQKQNIATILQNDNKKTGTLKSTNQIYHHEEEEFLLNDENDISESLKTGFYFFLALSAGAVVFIVFKIYRLRLSRAERKYGVQGDRSNQELTPLPISIEDGHSDDEDQTVFEIQRQNIRIL